MKRRVKFVNFKPMTETAVNDALAFGEEEPAWRALQQVIETRKADCIDSAAQAIPVGASSVVSEVCGWDHLDALLRDLQDRRQKGINAKS